MTIIGQQRRIFRQPTAAIRNVDGSTDLRATIWYPAEVGAATSVIDVGPSDTPYMLVGRAAIDAPFARAQRHPVILYSHGFNGSAETTSWLGVALAGAGYVVIAVDHPGNTMGAEQTLGGALLWWLRAGDLAVALDGAAHDPILGAFIDLERVGVSGYSMGGLTALMAAGAVFDGALYDSFCATHPELAFSPPAEALPLFDALKPYYPDAIRAEIADMSQERRLVCAKAAFAIAPAVLGLRPESLQSITVPVVLIVGSDDAITVPEVGAALAASAIPNAELIEVPGANHESFINRCTQAGIDAGFATCAITVQQELSHRMALEAALALFDRVLR